MRGIFKKIISGVLACTVIISSGIVFAAEVKPTLALPKHYIDINVNVGSRTPFKPPHMYGGMQNPPDFTWTKIDDATAYDLIVCRDEALTDVAYKAEKIERHSYNFSYTFEPGTYWWSIRYWNGSKVSDWGTPRRFRIDPDAYVFTVPETEELVKVVPTTHPRVYFTNDEEKAAFIAKADNEAGTLIKAEIVKTADMYIKQGVPDDPGPGVKYNDEYLDKNATSKAVNIATDAADKASVCALAYILTGDTKYKDFSIKDMIETSKWDYLEGWSSFKWQDQGFFAILSGFSYAYDWLYNEMTEEERKTIGGHLKDRFDVVKDTSLDTIRINPYNSHIWSYMPNYGVCAIVLMHDYPEVNQYFTDFLELWIPNYVPMSTEDGGWSKGTAYWTYAYTRDNILAKILTEGGYINMYDKAWHRNQYIWAMYMMPYGSFGSFGDESNKSQYENNGNVVRGLNEDAYYMNNPVAAWARNKKNPSGRPAVSAITGPFDSYVSSAGYDITPREPVEYPNSWTFVDQGITAMHSDFVSDAKTSLYFRASRYGSYNHLMCDQNSFIIEANGERLAARSGWYDTYHSTHDSGFTRRTHANNSITYDVSQGQKDDSMDANGETTMFVTQGDFDAVVGDATDAYVGGLDLFERSIIYVRPDSYIVVDNLDAGGKQKSFFEWWLNTVSGNALSIHEDGKGANITASAMALDTRVHYPEKVTGRYSDVYSGADMVNYPPTERYAAQIPDKRVWFETEPLEKTKMVTTMNVHSSSEGAKNVTETKGANYVKLEFEDGTVAVVSTTTDKEAVIDSGDVQFVGTAAVYNEESVMLVGGKSLSLHGVKLFESENVITAVTGKGILSFSSNDDYSLKVFSGNALIPKIESLVEYNGGEIISADVTGFGAEIGEDGTVSIAAQKGHYSTRINGKALPGEATGEKFSLEIVIDGESKMYEGDVIYNAAYNKKATVDVEISTGMYKLISSTGEVSHGIPASATRPASISGKYQFTLTDDAQRYELESVPIFRAEVEHSEDYEAAYAECTVVVEAEDYIEKVGSPRETAGLEFLVGISKHDKANDKTYYEVEIPEDGYYDFAMRAAVWAEPYPLRAITIDNNTYVFEVPFSNGWGGTGPEDFDPFKIFANAYLTKGKHNFEISVFTEAGNWNYDWIGFIKK